MKKRWINSFKILSFAFVAFMTIYSVGPYCAPPEDIDEIIAEAKAVEDTIKRVKISMLDKRWAVALEDLNRLINQFPKNEEIKKAYFLRAKALQNIRGREEEAFRAYDEYISQIRSKELDLWMEEAKIAKSALAKSLYLDGKRNYLQYLTNALKKEKSNSVKAYTALQLAKLHEKSAAEMALPILVDFYVQEQDPIIKNEYALGIISIDPSKLPPVTPELHIIQEGKNDKTVILLKGKKQSSKKMPSWIMLRIHDKRDKKDSVHVRFPISFAKLLINALPAEMREDVKSDLKAEGLDFDAFWISLQNLDEKNIFQLEDEDVTIEIKLE